MSSINNDRKRRSTSKGGKAKINRAIRQLENVERLVSSLPKKTYKQHRDLIENVRQRVENLIDDLATNLSDVAHGD